MILIDPSEVEDVVREPVLWLVYIEEFHCAKRLIISHLRLDWGAGETLSVMLEKQNAAAIWPALDGSMKRLAWFCLFVIVVIPALAQSAPAPAGVVASKPVVEKNLQSSSTYTVSVLNDNSWHFWLPFGFNVFVALGGFISVYFLYRQTKAATLNVEAVLRGQRAWLLVKPEPLDFNSYRNRIKIEGERAAREFKLAIKNVGITPAQLEAVSARAVLQEYGAPAREEPKYAEEETPATRLLVPNDSIGHFVQIETDCNMSDLFQRMASGELSILIYGYARYLDVYDREHRVSFGLRRRLKWENAALAPTVVDDNWPPHYDAAS